MILIFHFSYSQSPFKLRQNRSFSLGQTHFRSPFPHPYPLPPPPQKKKNAGITLDTAILGLSGKIMPPDQQATAIDLSIFSYCVRGTRTQPLICVGCYVPYCVSCAINKGGYFEIAFSSSSTHICLTLKCLLTFCLTLTS